MATQGAMSSAAVEYTFFQNAMSPIRQDPILVNVNIYAFYEMEGIKVAGI